QLNADVNFRKETGKINGTYIKENIGATAQIMKYIYKQLIL
ncbi:MAG: 3-deoxy-D-manno-octulosonic acid transferase, partial [Flavobacteriaceae bacterium]|nr:3-deoxy-D-manno-octulosonic acid transferase [Flavobacteriaceae bacterium]